MLLILIASFLLAIASLSICLYFRSDFYRIIDSLQITDYNMKDNISSIKRKAKNIKLYADTKQEKRAIKDLLESVDQYTSVSLYDMEGNYIGGNYAKILNNKGTGFTPIESIMLQFDYYVYSDSEITYVETIPFKDTEADIYINAYHKFKIASYYFYFSIILSIFIFLSPTLIFVSRKMRYINRIHNQVSIMKDGNLNSGILIKGNDEIASLSKQIDSLRLALMYNIDKEAESRKANRDLIRTLSHDLRTPLTTLNGYLEIIALQKGNQEMYQEYIQRSLGKIEEIKELSNNILSYAQVYKEEEEIKNNTISYEIWFPIIKENIDFMHLKGFNFTLDDQTMESSIYGNIQLIKRIFNNLFSNISKYANKEEPVLISCMVNKNIVEITLINTKDKLYHKRESNHIGLKSVDRMMKSQDGESFVVNGKEVFSITLRFAK